MKEFDFKKWVLGLGLLAGIQNAYALRLDISPALEAQGVPAQVSSQVPGNNSNAKLTHAYVDLNDQSMSGSVQFRLHFKHQNCTRKPWPLRGKWCVDSYNFWTTLTADVTFGPGCQVTRVNVRKHDSSDNLMSGIFHEFFTWAEPFLEVGLPPRLTAEIHKNEEARNYCH